MMTKKIIFFVFLGSLMACQNNSGFKSEKSIEEITSEGAISNADIIRSPISAQKPQDTVNVAKIVFEQEVFDFGEVEEGTLVKYSYSFTNTGKMPLIISNARSTCGCTVPNWPKDPIPPGKGGIIEVEFNTEGKTEIQSKPITITANTYPASTKVFLKGFVKPGKADSPNS